MAAADFSRASRSRRAVRSFSVSSLGGAANGVSVVAGTVALAGSVVVVGLVEAALAALSLSLDGAIASEEEKHFDYSYDIQKE